MKYRWLAAARMAGVALLACVAFGAAQAQYNPATQGKTSLYADPKSQMAGQMIYYRGTGLCLSAQNGVFRDWTPILLEACDGSPRQQFRIDGDQIRLAPNTRLCLDRQRIQGGTENGELNLENCSEQRTKWRLEGGAGQIRGTSHVNYSICIYPQGNRAAPGVRMMAGPPGCSGGQALGYGSMQQAMSGAGPKPQGGGQGNPGNLNTGNSSAPYQIFWRQVGGPWSTGPYPSQTPTCLHGNANAACNGQNFKGTYQPGQVTTFWLNGCQAPPLQIQCEVRDASGRVIGGPPKPPAQAAAKSFHVQVQAGLCIDVSGGRTMGGTAVQLWPCHGKAPQKFTIDAAQGRIRYAAKPDMCVDQEQGGGRKLELTECQHAWNRWSYDARNMRIVGPNNQCWDVPSGRFDQGQRLQVWACNSQPPQGFFYDN